MYAYVLIHFGDKINYLEYELYFLCNLRNFTKKDIIYFYSINDTPNSFLDIIKNLNLNIKLKGYNDKGITYNIKNFKSVYNHFNTLRTCNFIFSYLLTKYKKVCILESDMIIMNDIDKVFELKCPSVYYKFNKNNLQKNDTNYLLNIDQKKVLDNCYNGSPINGGVLLIEPNINDFKKLYKNIKNVILNNCTFPNETLFISSVNPLYNLPIRYNFSHYRYKTYYEYKKINIVHFDNTIYKPLDVVKDQYYKKIKNETKKKFILYYKKNIYDKYSNKINKILNKFN